MCADTSRSAPVPNPVTRVGIVARAGLTEAAPVVRDVVDWLTERDIIPVVERGTAKLADLNGADAAAFSAWHQYSPLTETLSIFGRHYTPEFVVFPPPGAAEPGTEGGLHSLK